MVDAKRIVIETTSLSPIVDVYSLIVYRRTNSDTCIIHRPMVSIGDKVKAGDILGDGFSTDHGELALGRNLVVAYICGEYCYEEGIGISARLVQDDVLSVEIQVVECMVRESRFGPEKVTRDVPGVNEESLSILDEYGIVRIGSYVKGKSIVVGKVSPSGNETSFSPEKKIIKNYFW